MPKNHHEKQDRARKPSTWSQDPIPYSLPLPSQLPDPPKPHHIFGKHAPHPDNLNGVSHVGEFRLETLPSSQLRSLLNTTSCQPSKASEITKILTQRAINLGQDPFSFIRGIRP